MSKPVHKTRAVRCGSYGKLVQVSVQPVAVSIVKQVEHAIEKQQKAALQD